jgi:1-acyl-sn-glycerol-3-phosphate acyltransferase
MDFWYDTAKAVVGTYIAVFIRKIHVQGNDNVPGGAKIVVANHALASDGFLLPFLFPEKLHFFVQGELLTLPVLGKILQKADQIPVYPGQGQQAMINARQKLEQGKTVVIFPEGKLNDGKGLLRAFSGAARLTLESGAPILPVGIYTPPEYVHSIRSKFFGRSTYGSWQFGGPTFVSIGDTLQPAREKITEFQQQYNRTVREYTDDIMLRINLMVERARVFASSLLPGPQSP